MAGGQVDRSWRSEPWAGSIVDRRNKAASVEEVVKVQRADGVDKDNDIWVWS